MVVHTTETIENTGVLSDFLNRASGVRIPPGVPTEKPLNFNACRCFSGFFIAYFMAVLSPIWHYFDLFDVVQVWYTRL